MSECVRVTGGRRDGRTEEEEEEEEGGADTALKTKTPHVNVGKNIMYIYIYICESLRVQSLWVKRLWVKSLCAKSVWVKAFG